MHQSPTLSFILNIPLLCDEIAFSLSPNDLAQCLLVNSAWNSAFAPLLWNSIFLSNQRVVSLFQTSPAVQQGLQRNADYVRSIHSVFCYAFQSFPETTPFRSLVRLDSLASELHNKGIVDHTNTQRLLRFIKVNTNLREIVLSNFPLGSVPTSKLLGDTIAHHPNLVSASINSFRAAELSSVQHVLRGSALGRLEKLSLINRSNIKLSEDHQDGIDTLNEPGSAPFQLLPEGHIATRLRDLTLDANLISSLHATLLPMLRHCRNLERLFVPWTDVETSYKELCPVLEQFCPKLQHLTGGYHYGSRDEHQAMLLRSCQHLRTYIMGGPQPIGPLSIAALLDHRHSQTLETLDIKHCSAIESRHIQLILTSCPNLASFRSLTDTENQYEYESRLDISDLPLRSGAGPAWVCKGLKDLRIGFTGFSTLLDKEPVQPYVDYIFRQLSVLTNLQTLYLAGETTATAFSASSRAWAFDFSLASGLGRLQSLRMLTTLNIQRLRHHRIGKGEAEWMIRHWPLLRRLYVQPELSRVENMGYNGDTIHEDRTLTGFLEELVRCRPSLTVSVGA